MTPDNRRRVYVTRSYWTGLPRATTVLRDTGRTHWSLVCWPAVLVFVLVCWLAPSHGLVSTVLFWTTGVLAVWCSARRVRARAARLSELQSAVYDLRKPAPQARWSDRR